MILWLSKLTEIQRWAYGFVALLGVGAITQWLSHFFAVKRSKQDTLRNASATFRVSIRQAIESLPAVESHWGQEFITTMPSIADAVGAAVEDFAPHLSRCKRHRFSREWQALKQHCEDTMPKALSAAEVLYGSGSAACEAAKRKFHDHVQKLLSFAQSA